MANVQRWGGEPASCAQCGLKVYAAEEVMANGQKWHRLCLKCCHCNKLLSSGNLCNHEDDVFCRPCHTRLFGPKGYGFAGGAATVLAQEEPQPKAVPAPLRQSASVNQASDGDNTTANGMMKLVASSGVTIKKASSNKTTARPNLFGGAPKCRRCEKSVYAAERVLGGGHAYHKTCFKCTICNRILDSVTLCERDEDLFCRACYGKNFGPKGFGFGISTMQTEAN